MSVALAPAPAPTTGSFAPTSAAASGVSSVHVGASAVFAPAPSHTEVAGPTLAAAPRSVADMHAAGVLTDSEFAKAKPKILGM